MSALPLERIRDELVSRGFKYQRKWSFAKRDGLNFAILVGLVKSEFRKEDTPWIAPTVAVTNVEIEQYLSKITNDKFDGYEPVTIATNIGYVMPTSNYYKWYFDKNIEKRIEEMCDTIEQYSSKFLESVRDSEGMLDAMLKRKLGWDFTNWYRVPIIYAMMGDKNAARDFMKKNPPKGLYELSPTEFATRLFELVDQKRT
jgi:hypothetical protein